MGYIFIRVRQPIPSQHNDNNNNCTPEENRMTMTFEYPQK